MSIIDKPEILAPAGSMEALVAAVRCGANAVYLGGQAFSARQSAANFDKSQLREGVALAHSHGVLVYQAINTLVAGEQWGLLLETLENAAVNGVDGLIVQDLGVVRAVKKHLPDMPLHASTQCSIHSKAGLEMAKILGFSRVVLARELSKSELRDLSDEAKNLGLETEVFVHGALCMSVSGQCYMSAAIGSRSANRGMCAGCCRLPFAPPEEDEESYALSLKELSLVEHLGELRDMGVNALKIEGRMRRPEYVAAATLACREALAQRPYETQWNALKSVFSRSGFTDGYYSNQRDPKMFGARSKEDVLKAGEVLPGLAALYKNESKADGLTFDVTLKSGSPVSLTASNRTGISVTVSGGLPEAAVKAAPGMPQITALLAKLGGTVYELDGVSGELEPGFLLSAAGWNALRREAVALMDEARLKRAFPGYVFSQVAVSQETVKEPILSQNPPALGPKLRIKCDSQNQLEYLWNGLEGQNVGWILPLKLIVWLRNQYQNLPQKLDNVWLSLPRFDPADTGIADLETCKKLGVYRLYAQNLAHAAMGLKQDFQICAGFGMNIFNREALGLLKDLGVEEAECSFELKLTQVNRLEGLMPMGLTVYGFLPLMLLRNCPRKGLTQCSGPENLHRHCSLKDRTGRIFPLWQTSPGSCQVLELLNCNPLYMADRLRELPENGFLVLRMTKESMEEALERVFQYLEGTAPAETGHGATHTRGLYYRGVE